MRARLEVLPLVALLVGGCGTSVEYVPLNAPPHPMTPRSPDSVELFTTAVPSRPFVEVGTIEAQQQAYSSDPTGTIYAKMREDAAQRGCDGLVILGTNNTTLVSGSTSNGYGTVSSRTLKGYRATCIAWSGDAPAAPPPVAAKAPSTHGARVGVTGKASVAVAAAPVASPAPSPAPVAPVADATAGFDRAGFSTSLGLGFTVGSNDFTGFGASIRAGYTVPAHVYLGADLTFYPINGTTVISIAPEIGYDIVPSAGVPLIVRPYVGLGLADATGGAGAAFEFYPGIEALYHVTPQFFVGADARIPLIFLGGQSVTVDGLTESAPGTTLAGFNLFATIGYKF